MQRREFLISGMFAAQGVCFGLEKEMAVPKEGADDEVWETIGSVLDHMFPERSAIPSAQSMKLVSFVRETLMHPSYDRDIRRFVIEGAQKLQKQHHGRFAALSAASREEALRSYENSTQGAQWLQRMMVLGMEGMFGDPVYGSNIHKRGWKALKTSGGEPSPQTRYITL